MPETESLRDTLEDIRLKLADDVYKNEEHFRLSLRARVSHGINEYMELNWIL